jgi:hypothetical protein
MENLINQYLDALVAHDPKRLPLSADVKYTENDQVVDIGDGFWKAVGGRGKYNHVFADPDAGQVARPRLRDGRPYTFPRGLFTRPSSILVTEAFLIEIRKNSTS